ncbi:HAMP domain-containing sensor histidine kinase [Methylobacterium sp. Leaf361]|uniref:sensor histidine kinase n=1 Tax=Methylobacterium sp. Leaf361 TaxID=1736352 RepID=UPI000A9D36C4|nr:HAMP domain-containing sensor histidine kinase [Methylobacterium sp. Leaf361]
MSRRTLPMAVRLPLVVVVFLAAVAGIVSWQVLTRLDEAQTRRLREVAAANLDGLAAAVTDPVIREDVWEAYDALDRARQDHAGLRPTDTVVATPEGLVLAASDPRAFPSWSALPQAFTREAAPASALSVRADGIRALARRDLSSGGREIGRLYASFDTAPMLAERRTVQWTLIATNVGVTLVLAALAWLTVRRMMRPVRVLTRHLQASGETVTPVPAEEACRAGAEFRQLYGTFNRMVEAVREREALALRLAEEERLASLGRLASGMAHEINNPLGGLFNAIDTLKAHGERPDVRRRSIELVERGLKGIRDVVRATLVTHRADQHVRDLEPSDLDDLRLLLGPEIQRRGQVLTWDNTVDRAVAVPAGAIRQIALNLLLNACQATPPDGEVGFSAKLAESGMLHLVVQDTGSGLDAAGRNVLSGEREAGATGSGRGNGLGLWMVRRLVGEVGGTLAFARREPAGTLITVEVPPAVTRELADVA